MSSVTYRYTPKEIPEGYYSVCIYKGEGTLPPLPKSLRFLDLERCNYTQLQELPQELEQLFIRIHSLKTLPTLPNKLRRLHVVNGPLERLPPLPKSLERLYCYENRLQYIPELPFRLLELNVSNNPLRDLPLLPEGLCGINLGGTRLPRYYYQFDRRNLGIIRTIQEKVLRWKRNAAARKIQKAWTRYWYTPNAEGVARYANYAWKNYISAEVKT
jgi:Leucine-rich repeat (LRR) protein